MINILIAEDQKNAMGNAVDLVKEVFDGIDIRIHRTTTFKHTQQALRKIEDIAIFVCDHNMPFFSDSRYPEQVGHDLYVEVRHLETRCVNNGNMHFIHHSYDPCVEKYQGSAEDDMFYACHKRHPRELHNRLTAIIKKEGWK